jgi:hypothetical protein
MWTSIDRLVELEARSTFSFQAGYWLADVARSLLPAQLQEQVERSKGVARIREDAERQIPNHLLFEKGWPKQIPTWSEADLLAQVRRAVAEAVGLSIEHVTPDAIVERYKDLQWQHVQAI